MKDLDEDDEYDEDAEIRRFVWIGLKNIKSIRTDDELSFEWKNYLKIIIIDKFSSIKRKGKEIIIKYYW